MSFEVVHDKGSALIGGQRRESVPRSKARFERRNFVVAREPIIHALAQIFEANFRAALMIHANAKHEREEPRTDRTGSIEGVQLLVDGKEYLLRDILHVARMNSQAHQ